MRSLPVGRRVRPTSTFSCEPAALTGTAAKLVGAANANNATKLRRRRRRRK
ncbi:MAG TPA: hypothetical protein PLQ56_16070 [Aggregatilineales bacterium]|nr:hypothetical protein [Aggregatilineales bacterium]